MIRQLAATFGAGLTLGAAPAVDTLAPPPALPTTAIRLLVDGSGTQRLALWKAKNSRGELCLGWTVARAARPVSFTCLRRGLERPLLAVETGGGFGGQATWGIVLGVVSPRVARVSADTLFGTRTTRDLRLLPIAALRGWRAFTTGIVDHPTSTTLEAYDANGRAIVDTSGAGIHPAPPPPGGPIAVAPPPRNGRAPAPTGAPWRDVAWMLGEAPASEQALSTALADSSVLSLLSTNRSWMENAGAWFACSGRRLGSVLTFRFAAPVNFDATLPLVVRPSGPAAYAVTRRAVEVRGARELIVHVDTALGRVVGVEPQPWPLQPGPGPVTASTEVSPAHDQGGPDDASCWQSSG